MAQIAPAVAIFQWRFDDAEFDEARRELRVAGLLVDLEPRPLEILLALLRHAGEVVTKEDLLDTVYGHRHLSDGAVSQGIRRLRRALQDSDQKIVVTVHRVGYKLISEVRRTEIAGDRPRPLLLKAGDRVPYREHWRLLKPLGGDDVEVWLIGHEKTQARRVLKLATDAKRLSALKREVTLYRVLKDALGERQDLFALIDWNFDSSPFFIECEYGGITLVEWAESLGGLAAIALSDRIAMVAWAAAAVGAAHSANVLHKDLKPTNILAYRTPTTEWRARLIDFGSGRLLDADRLEAMRITQQGFTQQRLTGDDSMSGTPLYFAPELLSGQMPTVQSDVYALGVILYQMAIGDFRKPIASGWEDDIGDPALREDIAAATHGNPAKRLESAMALAERLRSPGAHGRVQGRSQSAGASPRVRRSRRVAAVFAALTAGVGIAAWQLWAHRLPTEIPMSTVANRESIEAFQQVLTVSHQRHESRSDQINSVKTLEHAVASSPRFANAWALLSQENAHLYFNHYETESRRAAAARALEKAVELQPNAPDTLIAQGYYRYWVEADYTSAAATMRRVHAQWPEKRDATIALARISRRQNQYADAARYFEEALAQDRLNMEWALGAANAYLSLGRFPAALKLASHALDIDPTDNQAIGLKALIFQAQGDLAGAAAVLDTLPKRPGDYATVSLVAEQARLQRHYSAAIATWRAYLAAPEPSTADDIVAAKQELSHLLLMNSENQEGIAMAHEVRDQLEKRRGSQPADPWPVAYLALVYADLGEPAQARTLAAAAASYDVVKNDADRAKLIDIIQASVAARVGDKDQALDLLRQLLQQPANDAVTAGLLTVDPTWDSLRSDTRFAALTEHAPRLPTQTAEPD